MKLTLKSIFTRQVIVTLLIFISPVAILCLLSHLENVKNFNSLVGFYRLDTVQTRLEGYENDKNKYSRLELELKEDGTFKFNMSVPFIEDSLGIWCRQEGTSEGTWFVMKTYKEISLPFGFNQFSLVTKETTGYDGVFLNSTTPKPNQQHVPEIYFIKK